MSCCERSLQQNTFGHWTAFSERKLLLIKPNIVLLIANTQGLAIGQIHRLLGMGHQQFFFVFFFEAIFWQWCAEWELFLCDTLSFSGTIHITVHYGFILTKPELVIVETVE